jgi:hypothetical protein
MGLHRSPSRRQHERAEQRSRRVNEWTEEKPYQADCGHWVATPDCMTDIEGGRVCHDCAEYGLPDQDL